MIKIFKNDQYESGFKALREDFFTVSEGFSKTVTRMCEKVYDDLTERLHQEMAMCLTEEAGLYIEKFTEDDDLPVFDVMDGVAYLESMNKVPANLVEAYLGVYEDEISDEVLENDQAKELWAKVLVLKHKPEGRLSTWLQWNGILGYNELIWSLATLEL